MMSRNGDVLRRVRDKMALTRAPRLPTAWRYGVAVLATLAAFLLRFLIVPRLEISPFVLFYLAVVAAALLGGRGPGLLAVALSAAVGNYAFVMSGWAWVLHGPGLAATVLFCVAASPIALVCGSFRDAVLRGEDAARALRASEARLRLAQEAARIGSFEFDSETGVNTWSPEMEAMHGLPPGTFTGTRDAWEKLLHPGDRAEALRTVEEAMQTGLPVESEWRVVWPDGSVHWVASRFQVFRGARGGLRVAGINMDTTERRRMEQRLRSFYDSGIVGVVSWTADGRITGANDKFLEMTGYDRRDLEAGRISWSAMTPTEFRHLDEQALRSFSATGFCPLFEKEYVRKDGTRIPVLISGATLDERRLEGVAFILDITARKRAEASLRQHVELIKLSQDAVVVWCLGGGVEIWNHGAEVLYGYSADEVGGRRLHDLLKTRGEFEADLKLRGQWEGELVHTAKDGRPIPVWARMLLRSDGGVERVLEICRDMTERKATEARLAYLASFPENNPTPVLEADLLGKVRYANAAARQALPGIIEAGVAHPWFSDWEQVARDVRSAGAASRVVSIGDRVYHQDLLYVPEAETIRVYGLDVTERARAEENLREADRRKDEFLAVLSHELRNPLAPIRNSLYVLDRATPGSEQAQRAKGVIDRQINQMARLVSDLLDVSRIRRGKIQLQRERIDLREVVNRTLDDHRSVFVARGIELRGALPETPVWLDGDSARLGQALGNLLHNAAKFTNAGGQVAVSLSRTGPNAVLRVHDTGVGIAPDMVARVFLPFTQAERTRERSAGGLGLGLALVKGLVELHGGSVCVHSEGEGRGSEFVIELPAEAEPARTIDREFEVAEPHARRVLVIEDNVDAAESLKEVLEIEHHQVEVALTGPDGLDKARRFQPDVVFCDIGLPGMDGYQVARAFRSDQGLHKVPLIALTGYALAEDQRRAADAGFNRHMAKPPDLAALERILAELPEQHAT